MAAKKMKESLHLEELSIIPSQIEEDIYVVQFFSRKGDKPVGAMAYLSKKDLLKLMTWTREELKPKLV